MTTEKDRILARVRKLMTLANDKAASEGERNNAIRMAHATLAKHNLTMSEAEAHGAKPEEARLPDYFVGHNHPWTRTAASGIAKLFFCEYFYLALPKSRVKHYFVGRESNVITAKELSVFVINSIDREGQRFARESYTAGTGWRSFCKGAALRVYLRCEELRREAERPQPQPVASTGTALVLATVYEQEQKANLALIEQAGVELKEGKDRQTRPMLGAMEAGMQYGDKIPLHRQIGTSRDDWTSLSEAEQRDRLWHDLEEAIRKT
jgi:hypothetical protein